MQQDIQQKMQQSWRERLKYIPVDREAERQRAAAIALKNRRNGINLFQISWIMAFVLLIIVNWQMRSNSPTWPPVGVQPLNPVLPTLATLGLIASAWVMRRAIKAITADDVNGFLAQWRVVLGLGALFVLVMAFEWVSLPPISTDALIFAAGERGSLPVTQYNTLFRVMTAFHGSHALIIGFYMVYVMRRAAAGLYSSRDYWDAEAGAKLWYFVVFAWMLFYAVLYLI